jgi:hypothetical protein
MKNKIITLTGIFKDCLFRNSVKELSDIANKNNVAIFEDVMENWAIEGKVKDVEKTTIELWSMPKDQWGENGLSVY